MKNAIVLALLTPISLGMAPVAMDAAPKVFDRVQRMVWPAIDDSRVGELAEDRLKKLQDEERSCRARMKQAIDVAKSEAMSRDALRHDVSAAEEDVRREALVLNSWTTRLLAGDEGLVREHRWEPSDIVLERNAESGEIRALERRP